MTRRESREHVFKLLFQKEFYEPFEEAEQIESYFERIVELSEEDTNEALAARESACIEEKELEYIRTKYESIEKKLGEIDSILAQATSGWKLTRMGKVDLNLLRLAVFEIKFDEEVPNKVAVNEAVELAKIYGGDSSAGFINGVLAKVM